MSCARSDDAFSAAAADLPSPIIERGRDYASRHQPELVRIQARLALDHIKNPPQSSCDCRTSASLLVKLTFAIMMRSAQAVQN